MDIETLTTSLTFNEAVGHLGYLLTLFAYMVRDILWLRSLVVAACLAMAVYFSILLPEIAWTPFVWQVILLAVNLVWIVLLVRERQGVRFTEEERELHETLFRGFTALEFMKLLRAGEWVEVEEGELLANRGERLDRLYLVSNGAVNVQFESGETRELRDGAMIGEMSFLSGAPATATVVVTRPTRCLVWDQGQLDRLLHRNPSMRGAVMSVIGSDLSQKLATPAATPATI